ncbi:MAG: glycosyltransferase family 39 protein, partial [Desulfobacterales bacterium]|nr:glycosyltransferase family 39 protein [Desulfobacterales bacterium]
MSQKQIIQIHEEAPEPSTSWWAWLLLPLSFALLLMVAGLGTWPAVGTYHDQALNGLDALRVLSEGPQFFFPLNNGREGAFIDLLAMVFRCFGVGLWQLRLPSVIFGILGILGIAVMSRRLFGGRAGLVAAWLAAASPGYIMVARSGFRASMVPALACLAVVALLSAEDRPTLGRWALAGAAAGLGFHSYTAWTAIFAGFAVWLAFRAARKDVPWSRFVAWV